MNRDNIKRAVEKLHKPWQCAHCGRIIFRDGVQIGRRCYHRLCVPMSRRTEVKG